MHPLRLLFVPVLGLLAAPFLAAVRADEGQQRVFKAGVDVVNFGVTAVSRKGELVTDLTRDDFEVTEDGHPQTIQYFTRGLAAGEGAASHLGLMLDTSGSMETELKLARSASIKFL